MNQSLPVLVIFPLTKLCILFGMRQWPMKRRRHMARPRLARLLVRALLMPACSLAYSSGGGRERGVQSCDAIDICKYGCPPGMTKVAPPERSDTYTLRTGDGPVVGSDPTHYVPGELLPLYMRVVKRTIVGKGWCTIPIKFGGVRETNERCFTGNESAKYIGLLLYACLLYTSPSSRD